jgi:RNA polymerase sigma-70 factor (ECF subfamily)
MRTTLREVPGFESTPGPAIDDEAEALGLCRLAVGGDLQATERLLRLVAPTIARSVRLVLGPQRPDAEDVVQQSLLAFVQALAGFRGDCHPAGFASRIAVNVALTARRKQRERRLSFVDPSELAELSPLWRRDATDDELAVYRRGFLRDLLVRLPAEQAEVLSLHVIVGHSLPEIAACTATPVNTVKSRLRLAKESLRRHLEADHVREERT